MRVSAEMKIIQAVQGTSKAGKPYYCVGLLQEMDSTRVYVDKDIYDIATKLPPFCDVECGLRITSGMDGRMFVNMDSIRQINIAGTASKTATGK